MNPTAKRSTKYTTEWEKTRPWLKAGDSPHTAKCTACQKQFQISGSGVCQVDSHAKSKAHMNAIPSKSQSLLKVLSTGQVSHIGAVPEVLSEAMQVLRAEIIDVMYKAQYNHSFSSASDDGERFRLMFPGHPAAENYKCSSTKSAYLLQYGVAELLKEDLMKDIRGVPYTFKFDETATSQVKKQYDAYICYWSPSYGQIVNMYAGSLFLWTLPCRRACETFL